MCLTAISHRSTDAKLASKQCLNRTENLPFLNICHNEIPPKTYRTPETSDVNEEPVKNSH